MDSTSASASRSNETNSLRKYRETMKHIRTIIVDDEPAARARIAKLLAQDQELELVAE